MTLAFGGICPDPSDTLSMRSPRTKISWFFRGISLAPSIKVPARRTVTESAVPEVWARMLIAPASNAIVARKNAFCMEISW